MIRQVQDVAEVLSWDERLLKLLVTAPGEEVSIRIEIAMILVPDH